MADFCNACAKEIFNGTGDFAGLTPQDAWENGKACVAICAGCGMIQVDPEGNCASHDCLKAGKKGHGVKWKVYTT